MDVFWGRRLTGKVPGPLAAIARRVSSGLLSAQNTSRRRQVEMSRPNHAAQHKCIGSCRINGRPSTHLCKSGNLWSTFARLGKSCHAIGDHGHRKTDTRTAQHPRRGHPAAGQDRDRHDQEQRGREPGRLWSASRSRCVTLGSHGLQNHRHTEPREQAKPPASTILDASNSRFVGEPPDMPRVSRTHVHAESTNRKPNT